MTRFFAISAFLLCYFSVFGQTEFQPGYIIDEADNRIECLIKHEQDIYTELDFRYKLNADDNNEQQITADKVKTFGIGEHVKYVRREVLRSNGTSNQSPTSGEQGFYQDTLFLKVLLEGDASLYLYYEAGLEKFFFSSKPTAPIEELVFRKYLHDNKIRTDNRFRQQLFNSMKCEGLEQPVDVAYNEIKLASFFERYHKCTNSTYRRYKQKGAGDSFRLWARAEIMVGSARLEDYLDQNISFGSSARMQFGLSLEYMIPVQNAGWSLVLEPSLQTISSSSRGVELKHRSIEIPFGVRRYIISKEEFENTELYLTGLYLLDVIPRTEALYESSRDLTSTNVEGNLCLGVGMVINRISADARIKFGKDLMGAYSDSQLKYGGLSFNVGFRLY